MSILIINSLNYVLTLVLVSFVNKDLIINLI